MPIKGSFDVITVMDAFSRAILSSDLFQSQDLSCVLIVLYAAIERFGAPQKLISDNGGDFRAKQLLAICEALNIEKEYIHARQSWENLVETHFHVMGRMSQVPARAGDERAWSETRPRALCSRLRRPAATSRTANGTITA